jgi:hypothetical protein
MSAPAGDEVIQVVLRSLTDVERQSGVAYIRSAPLAAGESLALPLTPIIAEHACHLAFVDPSPTANWGHDCRYLTIDCPTLAVASHAARFPPPDLHSGDWCLVHRAPEIPDTFVFTPTDERGAP